MEGHRPGRPRPESARIDADRGAAGGASPLRPRSALRRFSIWLGGRDLLLWFALALIVGGTLLASSVQTDFGRVAVRDVQFTGADGARLAGLLYVPAGVTADTPGPAVLAVHGYINSRETQSGFAIELARRGMVVLALDQRGHGHSSPPAFAAGFGGPDALAWLREQPEVDRDRIALIGHSMGGWAALSAAAAHPDGYRSMVLVGSAPGVLGAPEGSATFPRNVAVVFARWDEFAELMWDAPNGRKVARSDKLMALFDSDGTGVVPGRLYGDIAAGTARVYHVPPTTHPGEHLSTTTIAYTTNWVQRTLGVTHGVRGHAWPLKELGTLLAMLGSVCLLAALPLAFIRRRPFRMLQAEPVTVGPRALADKARGAPSGRLGTLLLAAIVPAAAYMPAFLLADRLVPLSARFPQQFSNGLLLWVTAMGLLTALVLLFRWLAGERRLGLVWPARQLTRTFAAIVLGVVTVAVWLGVLMLCERLLQVDFRFWVVAMKSPAAWHWPMLLSYVPSLIAFFLLSHAATSSLIDRGGWLIDAWLGQVAAGCGGFVALLLLQYVALLFDLPMPFGEPLLTVLAIQFLVLLAFVALVHAVSYRATGTVWLGAVINGLWVGIVVVSGQATQFAVT